MRGGMTLDGLRRFNREGNMPIAAARESRPVALPPGAGADQLQDKKAAIVSLRWLLVIAAAYLMLFTGQVHNIWVGTIVVLMLTCNVVISRLPESVVQHAGFDLTVLVIDTVLLSAGLYCTAAISSDFYLLYFFVIFLAGASEKLASVLLGSILASVAYVSVVSMSPHPVSAALVPRDLALRLFFIFGVALFYGVLVDRVRRDRERRQTEYVTFLEGLNDRLRELVELKQAFVGAVSHELRTPLNALLGYLDLLRDGTIGEVSGAVWEYIDKAYRRGQHLFQLIEELLTFANLSRGRTAIHLADTDISVVLNKVYNSVQPAAQVKGLAFHVEIAPDVGRILTDEPKLTQILQHLAMNAVKFSEKGTVRISVARCDAALGGDSLASVLECAVSDTGPGIAAEQQQIIFEDFRQLDGSTTRRHDGMGLGLALCAGLVQLLRGELHVDSALGAGSTFTLRLPMDAAVEPHSNVEPCALQAVSTTDLPESARATLRSVA